MKTDSGKIGLQWLSSIAILAVLGLAVGCGGGTETADPTGEMTEDQKAVDNLVGKVSDISGNLKSLREIFTKEAAPSSAEAKKFGGNMFSIVDDIVVNGNSATMNVEVMSYEENAVPSTKAWKAEKVNGEWKLSDAPM